MTFKMLRKALDLQNGSAGPRRSEQSKKERKERMVE